MNVEQLAAIDELGLFLHFAAWVFILLGLAGLALILLTLLRIEDDD